MSSSKMLASMLPYGTSARVLLVLCCGFLFLPASAHANTCRAVEPPHYVVENGAVFYHFFEQAPQPVTGAEVASFKAIPQPPHKQAACEGAQVEFYAKDKLHVYYKENIISDAKPESFEILANSDYAKDAVSVFYSGQLIADADPKTFKVLIWPPDPLPEGAVAVINPNGENWSAYSTDSHHVWFNYMRDKIRLMPDCDAATFTLLPGHYSKDKNGVYREDQLVPNLDPKTFNGE